MSAPRRVRLLSAVACLISACCLSCRGAADHGIPQAICGTRIDPDLTRALIESTNGWQEYDRVDRAEALTAPCLVLTEHRVVLRFRFSWDEGARDLTYLATKTGSISGVTNPRGITTPHKSIVGTDGAISTTPCKTKGGNYFTLTLQLPQINPMDTSHRKDIEKFMRAYFPATLKTLGCGRTAVR